MNYKCSSMTPSFLTGLAQLLRYKILCTINSRAITHQSSIIPTLVLLILCGSWGVIKLDSNLSTSFFRPMELIDMASKVKIKLPHQKKRALSLYQQQKQTCIRKEQIIVYVEQFKLVFKKQSSLKIKEKWCPIYLISIFPAMPTLVLQQQYQIPLSLLQKLNTDDPLSQDLRHPRMLHHN